MSDDPGGADDLRPPARILRAADLAVRPGRLRPREGRAWLVDWRGTRAVLRQVAMRATDTPGTQLTEDVIWLHDYLARLAGLGFPSPRPLPAFGGRSWLLTDGIRWEVVSFLPGQVVGWAAVPPMEELGALLGRYHLAARELGVPSQRPSALPLAQVPEILLSGQLEATGLSQHLAVVLRRLAAELGSELDETGELTRERLVIHGDFTSHNVIADGTPLRASGVIDFALAHAETPLADIGYGLWRSGRPYQEADHLDLARVSDFMTGYASLAPVSADQASVIPLYLRGRGLQMIAKRVRAGRAETGMLAQVQWLSEHSGSVRDALVAAVA